ncbi:hypothetical protein TM7_0238, partial [candidate division TM7 genomosp. GTL1]
RFMTGQWLVLLGYALLPFFVRALFRLLEAPSLKTSLWLAVWMFLVVSVSLHHVGIMAVVGLVALVAAFTDARRGRQDIARFGALSLVVALGLNLYWLLPMLSSLNTTVQRFDASHFAAFATGPLSEVIRLQGFWAEPLKLFVLPKEQLAGWGVLMVGLWALVLFGIRTGWHMLRWQTVAISAGMAVAIILATTPLLQWASSFLPFVGGYREPHKFINLVALGYALCGGLGVMALLSWLAKKYNGTLASTAIILLLLLPIALTPTMLWGFSGQLTPRSYPSDWTAMNKYLERRTQDAVLFLPWHQYMNFGFVGRIIANPAEKFFSVPIIAGNNPEFRNISPTVPDDTKEHISEALQSRNPDFKKLGIRYVLVAKEYDYKKYTSILERSDAIKRHEMKSLILYEVGRKP